MLLRNGLDVPNPCSRINVPEPELKEAAKYNIICFTGQPGGRLPSVLSLDRRMMLMSTYEEFMVILTAALLIVAILSLKNK